MGKETLLLEYLLFSHIFGNFGKKHFCPKSFFKFKQKRQCTCKSNIGRVSVTIVAMERAPSITYSECVALVTCMQSACAILNFHIWPIRPYNIFPRGLINDTVLVKKIMEHKMCVLIFSTTFF
jgi:hypothetical protein